MKTSDSYIQRIDEKGISLIVYSLTIVVILLVAFLMMFPSALSMGKYNVEYAPKLHAFINGTCAVLLTVGFIAIRNKKIALHKTLMISAFILSCIFLLSYVFYHSQKTEPTVFTGEGIIRWVYFLILITHIVLAAIIVPLALFTILRSWRGEFEKHKKIARITFPLWLYVTVTGVLVYCMLYVWFAS